MTPFEMHGAPLPEAGRNARVYGGHILIFRDVAPLRKLAHKLKAVAVDHLGEDPASAHTRLTEGALNTAATGMRNAVGRDRALHTDLTEVMAAVGVDLDATFQDPLKLRVQPPEAGQDSALLAPLAAHRDTWGSNVMAQTNWWAPIEPITHARTIALFPQMFRQPVPNDSADWDLMAFLEARETGAPYPMLPVATEPPAWDAAVPIVIEPGDLLCFSGAHLHASVPNTTDRTRLSLEWRSVNGPDAQNRHGAPNVDGAAPWVTEHWFKHSRDGRRLGEKRRT